MCYVIINEQIKAIEREASLNCIRSDFSYIMLRLVCLGGAARTGAQAAARISFMLFSSIVSISFSILFV